MNISNFYTYSSLTEKCRVSNSKILKYSLTCRLIGLYMKRNNLIKSWIVYTGSLPRISLIYNVINNSRQFNATAGSTPQIFKKHLALLVAFGALTFFLYFNMLISLVD
jgi:hypothetical protein